MDQNIEQLLEEFYARKEAEKVAKEAQAVKEKELAEREEKINRLVELMEKTPANRKEFGVPTLMKNEYKGIDLSTQGKSLVSKGVDKDVVVEVAKFFTDIKAGEWTTSAMTTPTALIETVDLLASQISIVRQYADVINMSEMVQTVDVFANSGGLTLQSSEGAAATTVTGTTTAKTLTADIYDGAFTVSDLALKTRPDFTSFLTDLIVQKYAYSLDDEAFNNTSAGMTGGIFTSTTTNLVSVSGTVTNLTASDLSEMVYKLSPVHRTNARYYLPKEAVSAIKTGDTTYHGAYFMDRDKIHGYEYSECDRISGTPANTAKYGIFGDLKQYALGIYLDSAGLKINPYYGDHTVRFIFSVAFDGVMKHESALCGLKRLDA